MKYKWFWITAVGVLMVLLAYVLRDVVNERIVIPLSYLWWRIELYYHAIEEETWLVLAVAVISIIAYAGIAGDESSSGEAVENSKLPVQGPVEELTTWLARSQTRSYYRWLVANRLARLARLYIQQRGGSGSLDGSLEGSGWEPPEEIKTYLKFGMKRSPTGLRSFPSSWTRLNTDRSHFIKVVEYLESELGEHVDANK